MVVQHRSIQFSYICIYVQLLHVAPLLSALSSASEPAAQIGIRLADRRPTTRRQVIAQFGRTSRVHSGHAEQR